MTPPPPADRSPKKQRKDRLIQARVPRKLEGAVKEAARRRRLSVSQLVRHVLEDAFELVDAVVGEVGPRMGDSDGARRGQARPRDRSRGNPRASERDSLAHVVAWNRVLLNRDAVCAACGRRIAPGREGYAGLSDEPGRAPAWLCLRCAEARGASPRVG